jgi:hypothetical protein
MRIFLFLKKFKKFISGTRGDPLHYINITFLDDTTNTNTPKSIFPNFDWKKIIFSRFELGQKLWYSLAHPDNINIQ